MIILIVFILIMNQTEFPLVHNQKENCHKDHNSFNLKVIRILFLLVYKENGYIYYGFLTRKDDSYRLVYGSIIYRLLQ